MSKLSELQAKAVELLAVDLVWYPNDDITFGVDWEGNRLIIIDLYHPDGAVIQDAGRFDVSTIYEEAN
jgi:hypothetical protein